MFGWLLLAVGLVGFGWAGYSDLKTTEFRDEIPYAIIGFALLIRCISAVFYNDVSIILNSLVFGSIFLGFGILLYHLNQWGDGDAWLLGALGFLFPDPAGFQISTAFPFQLVLIFNFFFVSFAYLIVYSLILGARARIGGKFYRELKAQGSGLVTISLGFSVVVFALLAVLLRSPSFQIESNILWPIMVSPLMLLSMLVFVRYGKFIENHVFRRRIPVSELRVGDVPVNQRWKVMTKDELKELKKRGGHIWIKEGVRFAPAFVITMILTIFYGSVFI